MKHHTRWRAAITETTRKLPAFEKSLGAVLLEAKEAVIAPLRTILRDYDVTETQWRLLRIINDRDGTDATGLAGVSLLHGSSVTRILRELESRKLIFRTPHVEDKRRALVSLTPDGRELVKTISRRMIKPLREYSSRFGTARLERLADELRALTIALKNMA